MEPTRTYTSYLLRLWQVQTDTHPTWIASVQSPSTGEQRRFSSIAALVQFLQHEFGDSTALEPDIKRKTVLAALLRFAHKGVVCSRISAARFSVVGSRPSDTQYANMSVTFYA